jgi:hypothetical protein
MIGYNPDHSSTATEIFTGRVVRLEPHGFAELPALNTAGDYGAVEMTVVFPLQVRDIADPLVVTGLTGAGDLLYVRYIDQRHLRFGFDHWGIGGINGLPIEVDYGQSHRLELTMGSLYPPDAPAALRTLVRVRLDGVTVLEGNSPCHPATSDQIRLLTNPIGGSTCGPVFNGRVVSVERLAQPRNPPAVGSKSP